MPGIRTWGLLVAAAALLLIAPRAGAQLSYSKGQPVSPAYEGWQQKPDGSYDLLFGYMNDNWEEQIDVPVGPDNNISPGVPDQGQPTHFYPRRNRFVFRVNVPKDWANSNKELVWTLTTHGKTIKAYGTLLLDYQVDDMIFTSETGAIGAGTSNPEIRRNTPPVMETSGDNNRTVKVGQPLTLTANVTDDGIPKPRPRGAFLDRDRSIEVKDLREVPPHQVTVGSATGLWVALYVYREDNDAVHISPDQPEAWEDTRAGADAQWSPLWVAPPPPAGNNWTATATFDKPGDYILRWHASDGALWVDHNIHVTVVP